MSVFTPSPEPHAWRQAFALLALAVWVFLALTWLLSHGVDLIPWTHWDFGGPPVT